MGRILKARKAILQEASEKLLTPEMVELSELVAQLREAEILSLVKRYSEEGVPAADILSACQRGMRMVGSMHEKGQYFIAGLIMAGEIMRQVVELLRPFITKEKPERSLGRVIIGTIAGDIHDIGKNLFRDLLECHGFTVMDLGVDVPPTEFVHAAADFSPDLIAVSVLITNSFPYLREVVQLFHERIPEKAERPLILIGGGQLDDRIFRMSGSDYWAPDAFVGLKLCLQLMSESKRSESRAL